ncbi:unnamed protein product [Caretta caretta]
MASVTYSTDQEKPMDGETTVLGEEIAVASSPHLDSENLELVFSHSLKMTGISEELCVSSFLSEELPCCAEESPHTRAKTSGAIGWKR